MNDFPPNNEGAKRGLTKHRTIFTHIMKRIIAFFLFFISFTVSAQFEDGTTIKKSELRAVLELFNSDRFIQRLRFIDQPTAPIGLDRIREIDSVYKLFSAGDMDFIANQIRNYKLVTFDSSYITAKFMSRRDLEKVFSYDPSAPNKLVWETFYKKYGEGYCQISFPLFNKTGNICMFYGETRVGAKGGDASIFIYKKEGNAWRLLIEKTEGAS
jgi:hypothetical protein